jgi:hypothetical protein
MSIFSYRCPITGYRVEGLQARPEAALQAAPLIPYVAECCPACSGLHIVNPLTGRLIADETAARPSPYFETPTCGLA